MGRSRFVAAAVVAVLIFAGCSGSDSDDPNADADRTTTTTAAPTTTTTTIDLATVDTAKVDAIVGTAIRANGLLALPAGPSTEVLTAYTQAADLFTQEARTLAGGITGVPEEITRAANTTFTNVAAAIRAQVTCLRESSSTATATTRCAAETTDATNTGLAAGGALLALIPYGTRSQEEVAEALGSPGH